MTGDTAGDQFGVSVSMAGDVNGDGKADFIVGAWFDDPGGLGSAGSAYVFSGAMALSSTREPAIPRTISSAGPFQGLVT